VGSVVSVDVARREVVVSESVTKAKAAGHRAETVTLKVEPATELLRGKAAIALSDVVRGDHAVARFAGPAAGARALSLRLAEPVPPPPAPTRPPS
jgi:hypothetical protein